MKKAGIVVVLMSVCSSLYAQIDAYRPEVFMFERKNRLIRAQDTTVADSTGNVSKWAVTKPVDYTGYFSVYGSGYINSNSITNEFMKSYLYTASFIDADLKQQQVDRLKPSNRIGADINVGIFGQYKIKNTRFEAGLKYRNFYSSAFSEDAFKLVFYGNSMFAGQTADLSPMNISDVNYQALFAGAKKTVGKKKRVTIGARVGVVRGGSMQHLTSKNLSLYTDTAGAYLQLNGDFKVAYTNDSVYSVIPKSNGTGVYTDLNFAIQGDKGEFVAELLDLGFIHWNDVTFYQGSGSYTYDGVNVDNILGNGNLTINTINLATLLDAMGLQKQTKDITYMMPSTLHLAYFRHLTPKISVAGGVRQMFVSGYLPRVYGKLAYYVIKDFVLVPTLSYGGFGRGDFELALSKNFSDHLIVSANLFWFEYFAIPNQSSGHGMSAAFSYYF